MYKIVTLRCPKCGNKYSFNVGAGAHFASWRDIVARIEDKKESEKIIATFKELSAVKGKAAMNDFANNPAELLANIKYEDCGEETIKLLDREEGGNAEFFDDKTKEGIAASAAKWNATNAREGIVAYEAMYICPKTRRIKQGIHLAIRWLDDKKREKSYVYRNKCNECGAALTLIDDENLGFMHESFPTVGHCEKCDTHLVVEQVGFKPPFTPPKE